MEQHLQRFRAVCPCTVCVCVYEKERDTECELDWFKVRLNLFEIPQLVLKPPTMKGGLFCTWMDQRCPSIFKWIVMSISTKAIDFKGLSESLEHSGIMHFVCVLST